MKAFEEWDKKQSIVDIPEPFATFMTQEKERTWKAALKWILEEMEFEKLVCCNESTAFYSMIQEVIRKEIKE